MSYLLLNPAASELALSQEIEVIDSVLPIHTTLDTVNRFLYRLLALSVAFRYPSFCYIVLGSLPNVKVNELRGTRTVRFKGRESLVLFDSFFPYSSCVLQSFLSALSQPNDQAILYF